MPLFSGCLLSNRSAGRIVEWSGREGGAEIIASGSIPGSTRTLAVAIYSFAETGRDREAAILVGISGAIAFAALWVSNWMTSRGGARA